MYSYTDWNRDINRPAKNILIFYLYFLLKRMDKEFKSEKGLMKINKELALGGGGKDDTSQVLNYSIFGQFST